MFRLVMQTQCKRCRKWMDVTAPRSSVFGGAGREKLYCSAKCRMAEMRERNSKVSKETQNGAKT